MIAGCSRDIGYVMAGSFLRKGCCVLISGRQTNNIKDAVKKLASDFSTDKVDGSSCGISQYDQLSDLWEYAKGLFG